MLCGLSWTKDLIRQHIGAHQLPGNWSKSTFQPRYPCGMCGAGVAIGKDPGFLDAHGETLNGCYVWVEKEKDTLKGKYLCQLVGAGTVGLTSAAKSSLAQPYTNRPFKCVEKDCHTYVWTYSMKITTRIFTLTYQCQVKYSSKGPNVLTKARV